MKWGHLPHWEAVGTKPDNKSETFSQIPESLGNANGGHGEVPPHTVLGPELRRPTTSNADMDTEPLEIPHIAGTNGRWYHHFGKHLADWFLKKKQKSLDLLTKEEYILQDSILQL